MSNQNQDIVAFLDRLAEHHPEKWVVSACGITTSRRPIPALLHRSAYLPETELIRVLLVGGHSGAPEDVALVVRALEHAADEASQQTHALLAVSAVPCVNFDAYLDDGSNSTTLSKTRSGYPPEGNFYFDADDPETRYLWRWTRFLAPDLVLELNRGDAVEWVANGAASGIGTELGARELTDDGSLIAALGNASDDGPGSIPALRLTANQETLIDELGRLVSALTSGSAVGKSSARRELDRRRSRSPLEIGRILSSAYGHTLDPLVYTQGVAISGRLRIARFDADANDPAPDISSLVEPLVRDSDPLPQGTGTASLAGVLWGDELSEATGDERFANLVVQAADHFTSADSGPPPPADPDYRTEDMFFGAALLGRAYRITDDPDYLTLLTELLLNSGIQQDDGLFWHCKPAHFYWGRGNGFAALGLTEALTYLPESHPDRGTIHSSYVRLLDAARNRQEPSGMYPQVLDFPGSYQEFTSTCMFGYAMARGLRLGWLDETFEESLRIAWRGVSERIDDEGQIVDACTGTGVQESLNDYLDRAAIFGFDDRSGSMALWFAVEVERLART